eukprot:evm.model.scf_625.1 EVM.evm.TU.scf_625.1   scf_625:8711-13251(+)
MVKDTPARRANILGQRLLIPGSVFHDQTPGVGFYGTVQKACVGSKKGSMWVKMDNDPGTYWFKISDVLDWMVNKEDAEILRAKYEASSGRRRGKKSTTKTSPSDRTTITESPHLTTPEGASPENYSKGTPYTTDFTGTIASTSGGELPEPAMTPLGMRLAQFGGQAIGLAWKTAKSVSMSPWRAAGSNQGLDKNENIDREGEGNELDEAPEGRGEAVEVVGRRVVRQVHTSYASVAGTSGTAVVKQSTDQERVEGVQDKDDEEEAEDGEESNRLAGKSPGTWPWSGWLSSAKNWSDLQSGQGDRTASPGGGWWRWGSVVGDLQQEEERQREDGEEEVQGGAVEEPAVQQVGTQQRCRQGGASQDSTATHFSSPVNKSSGVVGSMWRTTKHTTTLHYHRLPNEPQLKYLNIPPEVDLQRPAGSVVVRSAPMYGYPQQHYVEECSWLIICYGAAAGALVFVWSCFAYYGYFSRVLTRGEL